VVRHFNMPRKMKGSPQPRRQSPYQASSSNFRSAFSVVNADPGTSRTLRWAGSVTSTASLVVTRANLLSAIVATSGSASTATALVYVPIYESVRIKRARIILPPPTNVAGGTITQEVSLEWSSYLGKDVKWSVVGSSSVGGTFSCRPPAGTRAAMWGSANTSANAATSINEVLFTLGHDGNFANPTSTVNCIIELDLDFVQATTPCRLSMSLLRPSATVRTPVFTSVRLISSRLLARSAFFGLILFLFRTSVLTRSSLPLPLRLSLALIKCCLSHP